MSFVEKNKAWLLPLLGVGVASVLFMNYRSLSAPAAGPTILQAPMAAPAAPELPPTGQELLASAPGPGAAKDLWADLKPLAQPPAELAAESELRRKAQGRMDELLVAAFPTSLPMPGPVREASQPAPVRNPKPGPVKPVAVSARPELEFIVSGPDGCSAWFQGRPYRQGEALPGGSYQVVAVTWNHVTLKGPGGKTLVQSTDSQRPVAGSRPTVEVP